jgi:hypothetical protein
MSFDLDLSTSPPRRPRHMTQQLFRLETARPFDPAVFGFPRNCVPACNRGGGGTSAPPPRAAHYSRTQIVPTRGMQYGGGNDLEEQEYLINRQSMQRGGIDLPSSLTLCAAVALWTVIIGVVFIMYWQFSASLSAAQTAVQPYFGEAINHTMSILANVDESTIGAHDMVVSAQTITDSAVPAMQLALNQTAAMITRLEKLAANPVLQISMTGGAVGGPSG